MYCVICCWSPCLIRHLFYVLIVFFILLLCFFLSFFQLLFWWVHFFVIFFFSSQLDFWLSWTNLFSDIMTGSINCLNYLFSSYTHLQFIIIIIETQNLSMMNLQVLWVCFEEKNKYCFYYGASTCYFFNFFSAKSICSFFNFYNNS